MKFLRLCCPCSNTPTAAATAAVKLMKQKPKVSSGKASCMGMANSLEAKFSVTEH